MALPASLQRAAPKRLGEFLAGRLAAREALRPFGLAGKGVAMGTPASPCGLREWRGSISHSQLAGLGVALCGVRPAEGGDGAANLEAWLGPEQGKQLWPSIVDEGWSGGDWRPGPARWGWTGPEG